MKKLEDIIVSNKSKADFRQPSEGHEKRFMNKNGQMSVGRKVLVNAMFTLVAASIIAVIFIVPLSIIYNKGTVSKMPNELSEAIYYYNNISYSLTNDILSVKDKDGYEIKQLKRDIEASEKWKEIIWEDYQKFPNNERVMNALIEYHRNQAEMLKDIYEQIKNIEMDILRI